MKKNIDILFDYNEIISRWTFRVPVSKSSPREYTDNVVEIYKNVLECLNGILQITALEVTHCYLPPDVADVFDSREPHPPVTSAVISHNEGVSTTHIENQLTGGGADDEVLYLSGLRTQNNLTRAYLKPGFCLVGPDTPQRYRYSKYGQITDGNPQPPFFVGIDHRSTFESNREKVSADTAISLILSTRTDIWFEETPLGRINRARLAEALTELNTRLDTYDLSVDPALGPSPESFVESLLEYDGPASTDLIDKYRTDWVQSHLREQATGEVVGDERIVDFGLVDEDVFIDELKQRIETYLQTTDSMGVVDEIRVTTQTGNELAGRVTDDGVDWMQ